MKTRTMRMATSAIKATVKRFSIGFMDPISRLATKVWQECRCLTRVPKSSKFELWCGASTEEETALIACITSAGAPRRPQTRHTIAPMTTTTMGRQIIITGRNTSNTAAIRWPGSTLGWSSRSRPIQQTPPTVITFKYDGCSERSRGKQQMCSLLGLSTSLTTEIGIYLAGQRGQMDSGCKLNIIVLVENLVWLV